PRRSPRRWPTLATWTTAWWMRTRPGGGSTAWTGTRSPPRCGRRSCPGCRRGGARWPPAPSWGPGSGRASLSPAPAHWDLEAVFTTIAANAGRSSAPTADRGNTQAPDEPSSFPARLSALDGRRIAQGRDFTPDGTLRAATGNGAERNGVPLVLDGDSAGALARRLEGAAFAVSSVGRKPYPPPPLPP